MKWPAVGRCKYKVAPLCASFLYRTPILSDVEPEQSSFAATSQPRDRCKSFSIEAGVGVEDTF